MLISSYYHGPSGMERADARRRSAPRLDVQLRDAWGRACGRITRSGRFATWPTRLSRACRRVSSACTQKTRRISRETRCRMCDRLSDRSVISIAALALGAESIRRAASQTPQPSRAADRASGGFASCRGL